MAEKLPMLLVYRKTGVSIIPLGNMKKNYLLT